MKFSEQIQQIMEHFEMSTTELADKISVPKATISHLISERNKPSLEFIMKLHTRFPSLNLEWLIYGKEPFLISNQSEQKEPAPPLPFSDDENIKVMKEPSVEEIAEPLLTVSAENNPEKNTPIAENNLSSAVKTSVTVESIVVFYSDGSFKRYTEQ